MPCIIGPVTGNGPGGTVPGSNGWVATTHWSGGLAADIELWFGAEVRRLVEALTERRGASGQDSGDARARWRAHRQRYIGEIVRADPRVRRISCADSLHNVRSLTQDFQRLGDAIWERFRTRSGEDQVWAYGALASALVESGAGPLAEELDRAVDELSRAVGIARP